jgi:hypothetical protein
MQKTEKFQFCNYADLFLFCNARLREMLQNEKMTTQRVGEFVVFLIGIRINPWWKVHQWIELSV